MAMAGRIRMLVSIGIGGISCDFRQRVRGMSWTARLMNRCVMQFLSEFGRRKSKARRRQNDGADEGQNQPKMLQSDGHRGFV